MIQSTLGCLFLFIFAIFGLIGIAVMRILRVLFNFGKNEQRFTGQRPTYSQDTRKQADTTSPPPGKSSGKIFGKDEGRYVDFEEV